MAINVNLIKKYAALIMVPFISVIMWVVGGLQYGRIGAFFFFFISVIISLVISNILLKNPFTDMIEGKGILVFNVDSTGVIKPFIVSVMSPFIMGKPFGKTIRDIFNRKSVFNLAKPIKNNTPAKIETIEGEQKITITLDEEEYNKGRFALFHYPVILYNNQIKSIITKDFLSVKETGAFAEHGVLYMNRIMEELTSAVRDFGRHVVESIKPKENILTNRWFWIIMVLFFVVMAILFAKPIIEQFSSLFDIGGDTIGRVTGGNPVTPR
jgi:hypothetical protein